MTAIMIKMATTRYLFAGAAGVGFGLMLLPLTQYTMTYTPPTYHSTPAIQATLPPRMGITRTLTTRIDRPISLEDYLDAFYSCWTLKIEGWIGACTGHTTAFPPNSRPNGIVHARGVFPEIYRDNNTAIVWWNLHGGAGAQMLSAVPDGKGCTEISYTCTEVQSDKWLFTLFMPFHIMYMRFLFHHAHKTLERQF